MSIFSSYKKIFLLGFIIVILIAIPFSVYIAQKRQQTQSKASASTTLSFEPSSSNIKMGEVLTLNIVLDPGTGSSANQVSFVKLALNYDSTKFARISETDETLAPSTDPANTLKSVLENPVYAPGSASISLSIGAEPTNVLTKKTKIAILKLKALASTDSGNPTSIIFDKPTQILSIDSNSQTGDNVLSTTVPATISIAPVPANANSTPTPVPAANPAATQPTATATPAPRLGNVLQPTPTLMIIEPTIEPTAEPTIILPPEIVLPPTGPGGKILGLGAIGVIFAIIGGALLILL